MMAPSTPSRSHQTSAAMPPTSVIFWTKANTASRTNRRSPLSCSCVTTDTAQQNISSSAQWNEPASALPKNGKSLRMRTRAAGMAMALPTRQMASPRDIPCDRLMRRAITKYCVPRADPGVTSIAASTPNTTQTA